MNVMFTFQEIPLLDVGVVIPCLHGLGMLKELNAWGNNACKIRTCYSVKDVEFLLVPCNLSVRLFL